MEKPKKSGEQNFEKFTMVQRVQATVTLNEFFADLSKELGFTDEDLATYEDNVFALLEKWEEQGYVEIYVQDSERDIGRLKDSNSVVGSSPWYIDLYHARISKYNDPLIVLRRDDETSFSVRFLTDHDTMFGTVSQKNSPEIMKKVRQKIDELIQRGNQK